MVLDQVAVKAKRGAQKCSAEVSGLRQCGHQISVPTDVGTSGYVVNPEDRMPCSFQSCFYLVSSEIGQQDSFD